MLDRMRALNLEGIYALPAFRNFDQFTTLEIRPEHLIKSSEDPYVFRAISAGSALILAWM